MGFVLKQNTLRGRIISLLKTEHPNPISVDALLSALQFSGDPTLTEFDLRSHLAYLSGDGKGYLRLESPRPKFQLVTLTSRGIDLLDGVIENDPGVYIVR